MFNRVLKFFLCFSFIFLLNIVEIETYSQTTKSNNKTIIDSPAGFTAGGDKFQLYINGIVIPATFYTVSQSGNDISVVLQTNQTEYTLDSGDEVVLSGKIK